MSVVYQNVADPVSFMKETGTVLAKSRMFGCETVEQGQALSLISLTEGIPFLELRRRYHIINGDLTMRADYMRAELRRLGGEYRWLKDGEDGIEARIWIKFKGDEREVSYTIENSKKEGIWKKGSRWEKAPGDMLRARCATKAIRMIASEVLAGFCTEEELGVEIDPAPAANGNGHPAPRTSVVDQAAAAAASDVVDAEFVVVAPAEPAAPPATATPDSPELATEYQIARIKELSVLLACGAKVEAACQKRGCNSVRSLRKEDAGEMLDKLEANYAAKKAAETPPFDADKAEPAADTPPCGPMTDRQLEAIDKAMKEFAQIDPAGKQQLYENLKAWLASKGLKLRQIDATQAAQLCDAIRQKSLPTFIRMDLEKHAGEPGK